MKHVKRDEIVDYQTYEDSRNDFRQQVIEAKSVRRIHVGDHLTFLFENQLTVRYQVQEMMRIERIVREADIQHELDTYNELLGNDNELGCTLLIEIDDEATRAIKLREWLDLPKHLYALLDDGSRAFATYDAAQVGDSRLSSVQFLKFDTGGKTPIALGSTLPALTLEAQLTDTQKAALTNDMSS